jgi:hypothetical protein
LAEVAAAQKNEVTVAQDGYVNGLERAVLVWLQGRWRGRDEGRSEKDIDVWDRLYIASRCTTQLVVVEADRSEDIVTA